MKKIIYAALLLSSVIACEKNEYQVYDPEFAALNIWLGTQNAQWDSTSYNFSYASGLDSIMFYARIAGVTTDTARTFTLEAFEGDITAAKGAYSFGTYVFEPGEYLKRFPIYFDVNGLTQTSAFKDKSGFLAFRVKEDGVFAPGAAGMQKLVVVLNNALVKPDTWDVAVTPLMPYSRFFGNYSERKYQFMIQVLGLVDFKIDYSASAKYDETTNTVSYAYAQFLADKMKAALEEYNSNEANEDRPMTDEFGEYVTF